MEIATVKKSFGEAIYFIFNVLNPYKTGGEIGMIQEFFCGRKGRKGGKGRKGRKGVDQNSRAKAVINEIMFWG